VTGFDGTPRVATTAPTPAPVGGRTVTVFFNANVNSKLPWTFKPDQRRVRVRGGEERLAFYTARNTSGEMMTGTATFNVTPYKAARYFNKVDCFCFTEQSLDAGQEAEMPVQFFVDPEIFTDPETREITNITLSYTFFRVEEVAEKKSVDGGKS
jgi:cytochrome c oxidase assembly protein subunit 11